MNFEVLWAMKANKLFKRDFLLFAEFRFASHFGKLLKSPLTGR
jgi:hypothetical protein